MGETIEIDLDDARELMLEQLRDELDAETVDKTLKRAVVSEVTNLYDNREQIKAQQEQQQALQQG